MAKAQLLPPTTGLPMTADGKIVLNVGLLFVKDKPGYNMTIAYRNSAGALLIAQDRIRAEHLLDDFWFKLV